MRILTKEKPENGNDYIIFSRKKLWFDQENRRRYEHELSLRRGLVKDSIFYYQLNLTTGYVEEYESKIKTSVKLQKGIQIDDSVVESMLSDIDRDYVNEVCNRFFLRGLREAYREGKRSDSIIYRRQVKNGVYHWVKLEVFMTEKSDCDEVIAFLYCQDIDREWKNRLSIETILDEDIELVTHVDVRTGIASVAHMIESVNYNQVYGDYDFNTECEKCRKELVAEEDQDAFRAFYQLENLVERLKNEKTVMTMYSVKEASGIHSKQSTAYYLDDTRETIVITRRDITRLNEEAYRQKQELRRAVDRANRASHAKSDFLSNMSHDIRTPLNAIIAFSGDELLEDAGPEKMRHYLRKIHESGEYLLGLVNDVLDMSKIERDSVILNPEWYSLKDFVKTIYTIIAPLSSSKGVSLQINTEKVITQAMQFDHMRFNQIFINLLSNAVKFTEAGGKVVFTIEELIAQDNGNNTMRFIVSDNGIGMSEEFLPHAFESFCQEYRENFEERSRGTGLGLAIVKRLVELMGGTISLESKQNVGTTFEIDFPVITDTGYVDEAMFKKPVVDYSSLRDTHVLLAEDKPVNAEIVVTLLEKHGCTVDCASNGMEACRKFEQSSLGYYKMILMDFRMPIMDGLEAAKRIRSFGRKDAATVPIIALTADAFMEDEKNALEAGMNAHIGKPIIASDFYEVCCRFVNVKTVV